MASHERSCHPGSAAQAGIGAMNGESSVATGRTQAPRSAKRRILFAMVAALLFFGLCEAGLRLAAGLLWLRSSSAAAGGGDFRVLCLGDSFTWGVGADSFAESYPRVLATRLNASSAEQRFVVGNGGVPRLGASGVLRRLEDCTKETADLFIILAGMNVNERDLVELQRFGMARANYPLLRVRAALAHLRAYKLLRNGVNYARLRLFPRVVTNSQRDAMALYNFQDYQRIAERDLIRICELARERGLNVVLLNYPQRPPPENPYTQTEYYHLYWRGELPHSYWKGRTRPPPQAIRDSDYLVQTQPGETALNAIIRKVTSFYGIPLIDIRAAFERRGNGPDLYSKDEHPNAAGYRLMGETVYEELARLRLLGE
ncbi:MAG: hypothetical protein FJ278_15360 [Planctomycetes bacterium]|nr:hypothetical protein [Planctomycetota bacterium]